MRGLNLLVGFRDSAVWERYQYREVQRQLAVFLKGRSTPPDTRPVVAPLFPGAMMFNQLLFLHGSDKRNGSPADLSLPQAPETFDSYYSSFNRPGFNESGMGNDLTGSVLVDCAGGTNAITDAVMSSDTEVKDFYDLTQRQLRALEVQIDSLCHENPLIDTVLFLQMAAYRSFKNTYRGELKIRLHQPDWRVFSDVFYLYRKSTHVVFVNNMRVLDAAYSACDCSIIVDGCIDSMRLEALLGCLEGLSCCKVLVEPARLSGVSNDDLVVDWKQPVTSICENSLQAFTGVLSSMLENRESALVGLYENDFSDFFDGEESNKSESQKPVITSSEFVTSTLRGRLADKRIKIIRKTNKLREDPRSFCRDSPNAVIRTLGGVLPSKKAVSG